MGTNILMEMQRQFRRAVSSSDNPATGTKNLDDVLEIDKSIFLLFEDISYAVRPWFFARRKVELLKNVSGEFRAGELTAIMGLSGAGKSTLMDVLTGFTTSGVSGNVKVNSEMRNLKEFRRCSSYIMQNDHLQPLLTVQEAMNVAIELKLTASHQQKKQKIEQILTTMNLDACRHRRTGDLSGGERKRLAIALELLNSPPVLFLDEPTSGLDSVNSKYVITLLKQLAKAGQTVICSIHQPSASLLNIIDHLYVIADGNCVYSGSTQNLLPYLSSLGLQCPRHYNPADYLLEICNGDYGKYVPTMVEAIDNGKNNAWRSISNITTANHQEEVIALNVTASFQALRQRAQIEIKRVSGRRKSSDYAVNFWKQFFILLKRNAIKLSRDKVLTFNRILVHIIIAVLIGVLYFKIGQNAEYVLDNFNLLFFNIMFLMFSAFSANVVTFPAELPIVMQEHFNRWYKLYTFYLANKIADLPIQFSAISLYAMIVYYMSDQLFEIRRFCMYTLMCFATSMVAQMFGLIVGIAMKIQHGMMLGPLVILPFLMFSGFFIHFKDAHPYLRWLFHLSFLKYGFEGVMITIYGYNRPNLLCPDVYCHFAIPETLLTSVNMEQADYWFSLIVLFAIYFTLDIGTFTLLKFKLEKRV